MQDYSPRARSDRHPQITLAYKNHRWENGVRKMKSFTPLHVTYSVTIHCSASLDRIVGRVTMWFSDGTICEKQQNAGFMVSTGRYECGIPVARMVYQN
jgi:hypothetical protein